MSPKPEPSHRSRLPAADLRIAELLGENSGSIGQLRTIVRAASLDENAATRLSDDNVQGVVRIADELVWLTWYERDAIVVAAWPDLYLGVVAGTLARAGQLATQRQ